MRNMDFLYVLGTKTYSKQDQKILNYIESNKHKILKMSCSQVASECYCSTATLIRFCQKHDLDGFSELKLILKLQLKNEQMQKEALIANDYHKFAKFIKKSNLVYLFGKGASYTTALYLYRQLLKLNIDVSIINDQALLMDLKNKNIIIISASGENHNSLQLIDKSNTIAAITYAGSTLDKRSSVSITHNQNINLLDKIEKEQQIHILTIINSLINEMR